MEAVQRRAAKWATRDDRYISSVTAMLKDLNWRPLDQHRIDSRLVMMYKVTYVESYIHQEDKLTKIPVHTPIFYQRTVILYLSIYPELKAKFDSGQVDKDSCTYSYLLSKDCYNVSINLPSVES